MGPNQTGGRIRHQVMRRQTLNHASYGRFHVESVWDFDHLLHRHGGTLGIAPQTNVNDLITNLQVCTRVLVNFANDTTTFLTGNKRQILFIKSIAIVRVNKIETSVHVLYKHLTRLHGLGEACFHVERRHGIPVLSHNYSLHDQAYLSILGAFGCTIRVHGVHCITIGHPQAQDQQKKKKDPKIRISGFLFNHSRQKIMTERSFVITCHPEPW